MTAKKRQTFATAVLVGGLLFAAAAGPAFAADRHLVVANDADKKISVAMLQSVNGKLEIVKYGDIGPSNILTFNVPNVATVVRVKADWCGKVAEHAVPLGKLQVGFNQDCKIAVK